MLEKELKALQGYLNKNLAKGFIRESKSLAAAPAFFIPKKDPNELRFVVDY